MNCEWATKDMEILSISRRSGAASQEEIFRRRMWSICVDSKGSLCRTSTGKQMGKIEEGESYVLFDFNPPLTLSGDVKLSVRKEIVSGLQSTSPVCVFLLLIRRYWEESTQMDHF